MIRDRDPAAGCSRCGLGPVLRRWRGAGPGPALRRWLRAAGLVTWCTPLGVPIGGAAAGLAPRSGQPAHSAGPPGVAIGGDGECLVAIEALHPVTGGWPHGKRG